MNIWTSSLQTSTRWVKDHLHTIKDPTIIILVSCKDKESKIFHSCTVEFIQYINWTAIIFFPLVLYMDWWLKCAFGKRDDKWAHKIRYGHSGYYGAETSAFGPRKYSDSWCRSSCSQRAQHLQFCLRLYPAAQLRLEKKKYLLELIFSCKESPSSL